jgi:serine/threonine-protein kinase RsbW
MKNPEPRVLEIVTASDSLDRIHRFLDEFLAEHPEVGEAVRGQIATATAEVGANIIEHAGQGGPIRMWMELRMLDGHVLVEFSDEGLASAHSLTSSHLPAETAERGRGLFLAQAVLSRLSYTRDDHLNRWTLVSKGIASG